MFRAGYKKSDKAGNGHASGLNKVANIFSEQIDRAKTEISLIRIRLPLTIQENTEKCLNYVYL